MNTYGRESSVWRSLLQGLDLGQGFWKFPRTLLIEDYLSDMQVPRVVQEHPDYASDLSSETSSHFALTLYTDTLRRATQAQILELYPFSP